MAVSKACAQCGVPFLPRTNAVTCSPECARKRRTAQGNHKRRVRYATDAEYRTVLCARSAKYRHTKESDATYVENERQRSARRMREKRKDPEIRQRDIARAAAYLRNRRITDPEFRERDNLRRSEEYRKARDNSARQLLAMLINDELAEMGAPCFVYQFFDDVSALLYVGITNDPKRRLYQHARDKAWFGQISVVKLAPFRSETEAVSAEATLIRALRPTHNIQHNSDHAIYGDAFVLSEMLARFVSVDLMNLSVEVA